MSDTDEILRKTAKRAKEAEREAKLQAIADKALDLMCGIIDGTTVIAVDKTTTGWFITFARKPS